MPTKRAPSLSAQAFFSDQPDEIEAVVQALRQLYLLARTRLIAFSVAGLSTGRARMPTCSPLGYAKMCSILQQPLVS